MQIGGGVLGLIALITWVIAAGGGAIMLRIWVSRGGTRRGATGSSRFPPGLIFGHFILAVIGLIVWIIYLVADSQALTWVAFIILLIVAALGLTMYARWARQPRGADAGAVEGTAERHFPVAVVYAHGLFAVTTLVLVLLVALKIGGS